MLKFNDAWVKGGGIYLAGPRDNADAGELPGQAAARNGHGRTDESHKPGLHPGEDVPGMADPGASASIHHHGSSLCNDAALEEEGDRDLRSEVEELHQGSHPKHGKKD